MQLKEDLISNRAPSEGRKFFKITTADLSLEMYADLRDTAKACKVSKATIIRCALDHFMRCNEEKEADSQGALK